EAQRGVPDPLVVLDQVVQRALVEAAGGNVGILVESFDRRRVRARDAKRAVGEDPLGVREMAHDLLDAPLARLVAVPGSGLIQRTKKNQRVFELIPQRGQRVLVRDESDVLAVILEIFVLIRTADGERGGHRVSLLSSVPADPSRVARATTLA